MVLIDFGYAILMCQQDMPVGHKDGVTELPAPVRGMVHPTYLSVFYLEEPELFALTGIKEIMTTQTRLLSLQWQE
jgi:hypothetical protein